MEEVINNLVIINNWIEKAPNPDSFQGNDEFMQFTVELMNHCLYLLRVGVALAPTEKSASRGYTKHKAIIVGHMVRIVKLYEGLLIHVSQNHLELASIFIRLIFETAMRMTYMMRSKTKGKTIRSFILASYKPEKEILEDLQEKKGKRELTQIEKRMMRKIKTRLHQDGISITELMNNRIWNIDGKDFRRILIDLKTEPQYSYVFANGSHFVHGDWCEIDLHHLTKQGRYYKPKMEFSTPDPRIACSLTSFCLDVLEGYLKWSKSDPNNIVSRTITKLWEINRSVDLAHERTLGE